MSYLKGLADKVNRIEAKENFNLVEIPIDKLVPSLNNFYGIREIEELAESIKESGLMHNLVVRRKDEETYEILSGERRYSALRKLGYTKVPCQVKDISDLDAEILLIKANSNQRELTNSEKMEGINRLKEIYDKKKSNGETVPKGKTRDLIGKDIGLSGVQVGRYMKVSKHLIGGLKDMLDKGDITLSEAVTLSGLDNVEQASMYDKLRTMNKEELKQEKNIIIEGIKQPVNNKEDKELIKESFNKEVNKVKKKEESINIKELNEHIERLNEVLKHDPNPLIVLNDNKIISVISTNKVEISSELPGYLKIQIKGFTAIDYSYMFLELKRFEKIIEIPVEMGKNLLPKHGYRINDGVYVWARKWRD